MLSQGKGDIVEWRDGGWVIVGRFYESPHGRFPILIDPRGAVSELALCEAIRASLMTNSFGVPGPLMHSVTEDCWAKIPYSGIVL